MEDKPIAESDQLLLAATATYSLTDMVYNEDRTELLEWGKKPGLIETVAGVIRLTGLKKVQSVELVAINGDGKRINIEKIKPDKSGNVELQIGKTVTPLYLVKIHR